MNAPRDRLPSRRDAVLLVARREIGARVRNRAFVIGTLVNIAVIVGLLFFYAPSTDEDAPAVALTGTSVDAFAPGGGGEGPIDWRAAPTEDDARGLLTDEEVAAALLVRDGTTRLLVRQDTSEQVRAAVAATVRQWATTRALEARQVEVAVLDDEVRRALPVVEGVDGDAPDTAPGAAAGVVTVLFFQLFAYGLMVSQGVVEEKSTRVVEVLLATVTPLRLMTGKVLGIGATALVQILLFGVAVVGADALWGVLPGEFPATTALLAAVVWFVLGFGFFAFLFAAAGSLASRIEDTSTTVMPVLMATLLPYGTAIAAVSDPGAGWVEVLRYVPPFSMLIMPLQVSVGAAGWLPNLVAAVLLLAAAGGLAALAAGVYRRSILRVGAAVPWRTALSRRRSASR
ncbi:ABC transporter permease [Streptomyces sp. NPDC002454]